MGAVIQLTRDMFFNNVGIYYARDGTVKEVKVFHEGWEIDFYVKGNELAIDCITNFPGAETKPLEAIINYCWKTAYAAFRRARRIVARREGAVLGEKAQVISYELFRKTPHRPVQLHLPF